MQYIHMHIYRTHTHTHAIEYIHMHMYRTYTHIHTYNTYIDTPNEYNALDVEVDMQEQPAPGISLPPLMASYCNLHSSLSSIAAGTTTLDKTFTGTHKKYTHIYNIYMHTHMQ